jgi:signal transduction histidine kinase/CheY-like chemotaxis protein
LKVKINADSLGGLTQELVHPNFLVDTQPLKCSKYSAHEHVVQFYESELFLIDSITSFISAGLFSEESALIIATPPHIDLLEVRLRERGLDVAELTRLGYYLSLDAESLLAELVETGVLSANKFNRLFGRLIGRAWDARRAIRIYGELVAVLWTRGQHSIALEVERLWNDLKQRKRFSLRCAYPLYEFRGTHLAELLTEICFTHSSVIPAESYSSLKQPEDQLRAIALLQQKAISLSREIVEHQKTGERLKAVEDQLQSHVDNSEEWLKREQLARSEAEAASRMKDEFLATVSHELRTPLNAIIGWSHMLNTGVLDHDTRAQAMESIERNAKSQAQLVEDLLDVSHMISGQLRLDFALVDVAATIKAAIDSVQLAANAKQIGLDVILDPDVAQIVGDTKRLKQIAWNLLSNAIKFTPPKGRVTIRVRQLESDVELAVLDTGQGIPTEFLRSIFDRFRQVDSSSTRRHGGLGLGLAIVRHLVELHGGEISAESRGVGLGSTFVVRLPSAARFRQQTVCPSPEETSIEVKKAVTPTLAGVRLLVVDDDADNLSVLTAILEEKNAWVRSAPSASSALDVFEDFEPDVFVFDLEMPGEDGSSLLARIKEREKARGRNAPAVALTAHVRVEDRVRALSAGFNMFVPKPVEPDELVAAIVSLLKPIKKSS